MSSAEAFLADIRQNPQDDTPRLVFADWLEDNGDPDRAELIRTQCERHRPRVPPDRRLALARREDELLAAHSDRWLGPLARACRSHWDSGTMGCQFHRGLVEVLIHPKNFLRGDFQANARRWFDDAFVVAVALHGGARGGALHLQAAGSPALAGVAGLALYGSGLPDDLAPLIHSPHLSRLRSLTFGQTRLTVPAMHALSASPHLTGLTSLRIVGHQRLAATVRVLPQTPLWGRLTALDVGNTGLGRDEVRALVGALPRSRLTHLALGMLGGRDVAAATLAADEGARGLTSLDLSQTGTGPRGAAALAGAHLAGLRHLSLEGNPIGDGGARALADSPHLGALEWLDLSYTDIHEPGQAALRERFGDALVLDASWHPREVL